MQKPPQKREFLPFDEIDSPSSIVPKDESILIPQLIEMQFDSSFDICDLGLVQLQLLWSNLLLKRFELDLKTSVGKKILLHQTNQIKHLNSLLTR